MLAVLTSYFNPINCPYRLDNYFKFRKELGRETGVDLFTFEVAVGDQDYHLESNGEVIMQARTSDFIFQKERTLNILLENLPSKYTNICWIDCDIIFVQEGWSQRIEETLIDFPILQPWTWAVSMPKCEFQKVGLSHIQAFNCSGTSNYRRSFAFYHQHRKSYINFHDGHVGYAWAARRDLMERHKLYDAIVTGCGDLFISMAAVGNFGFLDFENSLTNLRQDTVNHFYEWATPFYEDVMGEVGYTEDLILHLWHGDINKRNYLAHTHILQNNDFHPDDDLKLDKRKCWKWKRNNERLHRNIRDIFVNQKQKQREERK